MVLRRLRGREAGNCQKETQAEKEGKKAQAVQGEGLQEAEEVHVAAAVGIQAQVLYTRATNVGWPCSDRGHHWFCWVLFRAVRGRPGSQGTPMMVLRANGIYNIIKCAIRAIRVLYIL